MKSRTILLTTSIGMPYPPAFNKFLEIRQENMKKEYWTILFDTNFDTRAILVSELETLMLLFFLFSEVCQEERGGILQLGFEIRSLQIDALPLPPDRCICLWSPFNSIRILYSDDARKFFKADNTL